jgi:hypothetical protein
MRSMHVYEVRPRKDHRGVNLISDALPLGRLWYAETAAVSNHVPKFAFVPFAEAARRRSRRNYRLYTADTNHQ